MNFFWLIPRAPKLYAGRFHKKSDYLIAPADLLNSSSPFDDWLIVAGIF